MFEKLKNQLSKKEAQNQEKVRQVEKQINDLLEKNEMGMTVEPFYRVVVRPKK